MRRVLLLSQLLLIPIFCSAQSVIIRRVELAGEKIIVNYDLEDSNPNNEYLLNLYTSKDGFSKAVEAVTGDVGIDIKPGANKRIEWNIIKDYGGYKGKLSLEVRGKVYVPFVRLQSFDAKATYRRGKNYSIRWKAGNSNPVNIELFKGGQRITGEVNHPNNGDYELYIPKHAKTGGDYKLKFSDSRSPEEAFYTPTFSVKPKVPLLLKIAPVVIVGGVLAVLLKNEPKPVGGADEIEDPDFPSN